MYTQRASQSTSTLLPLVKHSLCLMQYVLHVTKHSLLKQLAQKYGRTLYAKRIVSTTAQIDKNQEVWPSVNTKNG